MSNLVHSFNWRTSRELNPNQIAKDGGLLKEASPSLAKWWAEKEDTVHAAVTSCLDDLMDQQTQRQTRLAGWGNLYGNAQWYAGIQRSGQLSASPWYRSMPDVPHYNVVQEVTDAFVSRIGKDTSRIWFITNGGDYNDWQRAIRLSQLYDGIAYEAKTERKLVQLLRDGCVFGDGWLKVFARNKRVHHQRVLPSDMWFDAAGAMSGEWPRQIHQLMAMDRARLMALYPDKADQIRKADSFTPSLSYPAARTSDVVLVRESWHLPSSPDLKESDTDGAHAITVDGATLCCEPYTKDWYPFVHYRWNQDLYGWCGQGIPEILKTRQRAMNKLAFMIDRGLHANSMNVVALQRGSKINPQHVARNDIKTVIEFDTVAPEYLNPSPVHRTYLDVWQMYKADCFEVVGLSQMAAAGVHPAGLDSGESQRVFHDITDERNWNPSKEWEDCAVETGRLSIETVRDIAREQGGGYKARSQIRPGYYEDIDWRELKYPSKSGVNPFITKAFAASPVSTSPAGRLADLNERFQAGMITPTEFKRMQANPDLPQLDALDTAAENWIYKVFNKATSGDVEDFGPGDMPDDRDNLVLFVSIGTQIYELCKTRGIEPERLALVERIISAAQARKDSLEQRAMQQAAQKQAAMQAMQPPPPGAPPQGPMPQGGPPGMPPPNAPTTGAVQ